MSVIQHLGERGRWPRVLGSSVLALSVVFTTKTWGVQQPDPRRFSSSSGTTSTWFPFPLISFFFNLPNILTPPAYLLPTGCVAGWEGRRPTSKRNVSLQQATGQAGSTLGVRHRTPFEEGKGGAIDRTWGNAHGSGGLPNGAATSLRRRGLV